MKLWPAAIATGWFMLLASAATAQEKYMGGTLALAPGVAFAPRVVIYMCPVVESDGRQACEQALSAEFSITYGGGTFNIGPIPDLRYGVYAWRDGNGDNRLNAGDEWAVYNIYPHREAFIVSPTNNVALRLRPYDGTSASVLHNGNAGGVNGIIEKPPEELPGRYVLSGSPYDMHNSVTGHYVSTNSSSQNLELRADGTFTETSVFNNDLGCSVYEDTGSYVAGPAIIRFSNRVRRKKDCLIPGWRPSYLAPSEIKAWRFRYAEGYGIILDLAEVHSVDETNIDWIRAEDWAVRPY